jgi:hypothetical protein
MTSFSTPPPAPETDTTVERIHWSDARLAAVVVVAYILQAVRR